MEGISPVRGINTQSSSQDVAASGDYSNATPNGTQGPTTKKDTEMTDAEDVSRSPQDTIMQSPEQGVYQWARRGTLLSPRDIIMTSPSIGYLLSPRDTNMRDGSDEGERNSTSVSPAVSATSSITADLDMEQLKDRVWELEDELNFQSRWNNELRLKLESRDKELAALEAMHAVQRVVISSPRNSPQSPGHLKATKDVGEITPRVTPYGTSVSDGMPPNPSGLFVFNGTCIRVHLHHERTNMWETGEARF